MERKIMFRIIQKLNFDEIHTYWEDEYFDTDELVLGYVEDEFFAQEFCNTHKDCYYECIIPCKYPLQLEAKLRDNPNDVTIFKIPIQKPEWMYDE
jgi:hypothetical protein